MSACLSESQIREILDGQLSSEMETRVLAHLDDCLACQTRLWGGAGGNEKFPSLSIAGSTAETVAHEPTNLSRVIQVLQQSWRSEVNRPLSDSSGRIRPESQDQREPRVLLPSRYRETQPVAAGGFGEVYRAFDEVLQRPVAIKAPRADLQRASGEDFLAEARVLAQLDHPNIVPIYDFGRAADGQCFIAYKWIEGPDLARRLATESYREQQTFECLERVARGLHHAHLRGVIHCDIKPGNILIDEGGIPVLVDFGLAVTRQPRDQDSNWLARPPI